LINHIKMKSIVKLLVFLLTAVLISQCKKDEPIHYVTIPDSNFLHALIALGVDTDGDGKISTDEAEVLTFLNVGNSSISDITGIGAFVNLDTLSCSF